jgi:hypothetical protein
MPELPELRYSLRLFIHGVFDGPGELGGMEVPIVKHDERARRSSANRMLMRKSYWIIFKRKLIVLASPSPDNLACRSVDLCDLIGVPA